MRIVRNPYKYDGEIVRVNANLNWFMHGFYLTDANCSGEDDSTKTAINFNERKRKYVEKFKYTGETPKPIEIVAVGVFYKMRIGGSDGIEDRTRLRFEIYNIEYSSR